MQYAVDRLMTSIREMVLRDGVAGLVGSHSIVRRDLEQEATAIAEHDTLDSIEAVQTESSLFPALDTLENDWRAMRRASEDWLTDANGNLRFSKIEDDHHRGIARFSIHPERQSPTMENMPLVAWDLLATDFAPVAQRPGSFNREDALRMTGARVFRSGEPFIDAVADFTRWDDRGRTFAMWRYRAVWSGNDDYVGFKRDTIGAWIHEPPRGGLTPSSRPSLARSGWTRPSTRLRMRLFSHFSMTDTIPSEATSISRYRGSKL
jgi:ATP-dependent helicase HepA